MPNVEKMSIALTPELAAAVRGDHHKVGARRLLAPGVHPSASPGTSDQMSRADHRLRPASAPGARDARRAASTASVAASPSVG
jgi:hypothetical protein